MMEVLLSLGVLGQELLNFHYRRGAILSQKLLNRELLNINAVSTTQGRVSGGLALFNKPR
jgi:hypothetical protein